MLVSAPNTLVKYLPPRIFITTLHDTPRAPPQSLRTLGFAFHLFAAKTIDFKDWVRLEGQVSGVLENLDTSHTHLRTDGSGRTNSAEEGRQSCAGSRVPSVPACLSASLTSWPWTSYLCKDWLSVRGTTWNIFKSYDICTNRYMNKYHNIEITTLAFVFQSYL